MTYEVIEDIRKNRVDLLSSIDYIIPNKHIKTYHVKHKPEIKPSEIENVLINEFNQDSLKYEYIPETDDENTTLDKIKYSNESTLDKIKYSNESSLDKIKYSNDSTLVKLKHSKHLKHEDTIPNEPDTFILNDFDDDNDFDLESLQNTLETELCSKVINDEKDAALKADFLLDNSHSKDFLSNVNIISNKKDILTTTEGKELLNIEDNSKDSLLFSLLTSSKPKRSKKKSDVQTEPTSKPRKFERKKRARINKDNWEIKILSEDEALEQFKQRINNSKYVKFNFKCNKCLKGFSKNDILLRHNKQCHDEVR